MTETDTNAAPSKSTRRTVLRAGATAAWAVPAIQVATAVPAFAAVSTAPKLVVTASSLTYNASQNKFTGSITLKNSGTTTSSAVTVVLSNLRISKNGGPTFTQVTGSGTVWSNPSSGWGSPMTGKSASGATATSNAGIAGGQSLVLGFSVTVAGNLVNSSSKGKLDFAGTILAPGTSTASGTLSS